ncbi:GntR family transcriptional regulator [Dinoroseobacter sp. S375]|uniref:GntR family transcriptional regulator n=1 Tax=Dinoroseobacter sp. S375 TaxID=3415136 RepID=UPI003C7D9423
MNDPTVTRKDNPELNQGGAAYAALLKAIRAGHYAPGDRLREVEIAERLSLSRTPIREALRRLEADGIVEHKARIGAVIRQLSHAEVVELYEMRLVLERTASELAAKHAVGAQVDELAALNAQIAACQGDSQRAAAINQQFHEVLYRAGRNRFLLEAARALNNALLLLGPTTLADEARIETVCHQHDAIIDAIRAGDEAAAGAAAEAHLETSLRHRLAVMRAL